MSVLALLVFCSSAFAQTPVQAPAQVTAPYVLGTSFNLTGGGSNRPQILFAQPTGKSSFAAFYGFYPTLSLMSTRPNSSLNASYSLGLYRTPGSLTQPPPSHTATLNFAPTLGPRWTTVVSDSFNVSDALGRVNSLSGAVPGPAGSSIYPFSASGAGTTTYRNIFNASLGWNLEPNASLSFFANHSLQQYSSRLPANGLVGSQQQVFLANQQQAAGGLRFLQALGTTESLGITYQGTHSDYGNAASSVSQSGSADYSMQFGPSIMLQIGAGLTQVNSAGAGKMNYDAKANLAKTIQSNTFSLSYVQDSSQQVGLGSTSTTQRGTLDWKRTFGKMTAAASGSAYQSKGILNNSLRLKGVEAATNVAIPLTSKLTFSMSGRFDQTHGSGTPSVTQRRIFGTGDIGFALTSTLVLSGGLTYQDTSQTGTLRFNQERVFISLKYTQPNLIGFR